MDAVAAALQVLWGTARWASHHPGAGWLAMMAGCLLHAARSQQPRPHEAGGGLATDHSQSRSKGGSRSRTSNGSSVLTADHSRSRSSSGGSGGSGGLDGPIGVSASDLVVGLHCLASMQHNPTASWVRAMANHLAAATPFGAPSMPAVGATAVAETPAPLLQGGGAPLDKRLASVDTGTSDADPDGLRLLQRCVLALEGGRWAAPVAVAVSAAADSVSRPANGRGRDTSLAPGSSCTYGVDPPGVPAGALTQASAERVEGLGGGSSSSGSTSGGGGNSSGSSVSSGSSGSLASVDARPGLGPRAVAVAAWSLAALGLVPQRPWLEGFLSTAGWHAGDMRAEHVADVLRALCDMGCGVDGGPDGGGERPAVTVDAALLEPLLARAAALAAVVKAGTESPVVGGASGSGGTGDSSGDVGNRGGSWAGGQDLTAMTPLAASRILHAAAALGCHPSGTWLDSMAGVLDHGLLRPAAAVIGLSSPDKGHLSHGMPDTPAGHAAAHSAAASSMGEPGAQQDAGQLARFGSAVDACLVALDLSAATAATALAEGMLGLVGCGHRPEDGWCSRWEALAALLVHYLTPQQVRARGLRRCQGRASLVVACRGLTTWRDAWQLIIRPRGAFAF